MMVLRVLRSIKGMSQRRLARLAGLHPMALHRIEAGKREATAGELSRLADALALTPADLAEKPPSAPEHEGKAHAEDAANRARDALDDQALADQWAREHSEMDR